MNATYKENNCNVIVKGGEPYLILNIEKYCKLNKKNSSSHCDFVYVMFGNDGNSNVYLIELKDTESVKKENLVKLINKFLNNKLPQTKNLISSFLSNLGIRKPNYFGVLVLPEEAINKLRENYASVVRKVSRFEKSWITSCGKSIQIEDKEFPK
jgi:hypothetical protein